MNRGPDGETDQPPDRSLAVLFFAALVAGLGIAMAFAPAFVAKRFAAASGDEPSVLVTVHATGPALVAMGTAAWVSCTGWSTRNTRAATLIIGLLVVAGYVSLTTCLSDWIVDDAAITFAYSKNLATGHGLVINPGHAPEEGYSNTLWMLMLAAARLMGADIAVTAKRACVAFGALTVALTFFVCHRLTGRRLRFGLVALAMTICIGAPFIVWSSSGLEHGLQTALLTLVIAAPFWPRFQRSLMAAALSALVLTRPEAPLIVIAVSAVLLLRDRAVYGVRGAVRQHWPVLVFPAATWVALLSFRLGYFHEAMSNPYYAKSHEASWFRVVNFAGRGWAYLFGWLADARTWLLVPFVLMAPWRGAPLAYQLAAAICVAQVPFMLYFGGDWMGCYRFISPVLPGLAAMVVFSVSEAGKRTSRFASNGTCLVLAWFLDIGVVSQLITFRAHPTTPTAVVAQIGRTFLDVGHRLGVERPTLAHHDAGGTSYEAGIDLVDLGGLGDRAVAKHLYDRAFMRKYIFEERRPTFVFGSNRSFAAGKTQFFLMSEFDQYVPIRFPGRPFMDADLCHVRRDVIHAVPGIREVKNSGSDYWVVD
jgi:hypothetical protein